MKISIVSPDENGNIEWSVSSVISKLNAVPYDDSDVAVIPISRVHSFKFNQNLRNIKKPWVMVDFVEYGANDWNRKKTHFFGAGTLNEFSTFDDHGLMRDEWARFDDWVSKNPPILYFKRELLAKDASSSVKPIEYACNFPAWRVDSEEEYNSRPIEVLNTWGYSNEGRRRVHGEIFKMASGRFELISSWNHFNDFFKHREPTCKSRTWATIFTPHFDRAPMGDVLKYGAMSKMVLSMPGAGIKCFRHFEAPVNSLMVLQNDPLAWSFPWVHLENCIRIKKNNPEDMDVICGLKGDEEVKQMDSLAKSSNGILYKAYLGGLDNIDRYRPERYCNEYLKPIIKEALS